MCLFFHLFCIVSFGCVLSGLYLFSFNVSTSAGEISLRPAEIHIRIFVQQTDECTHICANKYTYEIVKTNMFDSDCGWGNAFCLFFFFFGFCLKWRIDRGDYLFRNKIIFLIYIYERDNGLKIVKFETTELDEGLIRKSFQWKPSK